MRYYPSPAKINLMLKIVRQEPNGYHYLQTIFQFTDLYDEVGFQLIPHSDKITFAYKHQNFTLEDDLIYKSINALRQYTNTHFGLHIDLRKNLPMGAGLGGGSSNAATTLVVLNQLWNLQLSLSELLSLGKSLGADVPIFIRGKSAWAEGVGEQFHDISLPEKDYFLIIPPVHISTKTIFSSPHLSRNNPLLTERSFKVTHQINDCESAIFHHYPMMKSYMHSLEQIGITPHITGTGSCIYIDRPLPSQQEEINVLTTQYNWQTTPFRALNHSLLFQSIA